MEKAFKAYDIRGVYDVDFNKDDVYRIGFHLPGLLQADRVLIGYDARLSSPEIVEYLKKGITDSGADVYDAGLCTTPMVYWATGKYDFRASVMVTASHNPPRYNGLKISGKDALPVGYDTGLAELLRLTQKEIIPRVEQGTVRPFDFTKEYLSFINGYKTGFDGLNIGIDCSNGMGALLIKELLGHDHHYIHDTIDGSFPNHQPNPLEPENQEDIKKLVLDKQCDVGLIFDGDADRVMFIDDKGRFVQPDLMIALLADYFANKGMTGKALQDIRTSKSVTEYVEAKDFEMHMWRVGRAYAALKLREIDGLFGGELAGHYYFRDFYYSDSAYLATVIFLEVIKKYADQGIRFSALIDGIHKYSGSGEMNFHIADKAAAMEKVKAYFTAAEEPLHFYDFDGYRIEFADWWFNIRPSNTEPYLRFLAEATTPEILQEKLDELAHVLQPFISGQSTAH